MIPKASQTVLLYLALGAFILGWWGFAFGPTLLTFTTSYTSEPLATTTTISLPSPYLYPLSREKIQEALLGDTTLMMSLLAQWDTEARLLEACGSLNAQRLSSDKYLKAQLLGRRILAREAGEPFAYSYPSGMTAVIDDQGHLLRPATNMKRFLPQTYVAANFLLALSSPEEIVALPKGLRYLTHIYPSKLLNQIPLDCGPYSSELLYKIRPDVAFVAPYSLPTTLQILKRQGCQLFTIGQVNTIEDVQSALMRVGQVVGKPEEAELLALFMEGTICALDNRLVEAHLAGPSAKHDILYLNYYTKFVTPTCHTLAGNMLQRLGINCFPALLDALDVRWQIPLEPEKIIGLGPKAIILSAVNGEALRGQLLHHPAFQSVPAIQNEQIYTVDPYIQDSPSQFSVLAYFDLVKALLEARPCL